MQPLTSPQRKFLRSQAHHVDPVVFVGKQGITDTLIDAADVALESHELIKVRFIDFKKEKKQLTAEIAECTRSHVAGIIGHVAILYRRQEDDDKRRIELPGAP